MSVLSDSDLEKLRKVFAARRWKSPEVIISDDEICWLFDTIDHLRQERADVAQVHAAAALEQAAHAAEYAFGDIRYSEAKIAGERIAEVIRSLITADATKALAAHVQAKVDEPNRSLSIALRTCTELRQQLAAAEAHSHELELRIAEAAQEINCAGPIAHRIRVLKQEHEAHEKLAVQAAEEAGAAAGILDAAILVGKTKDAMYESLPKGSGEVARMAALQTEIIASMTDRAEDALARYTQLAVAEARLDEAKQAPHDWECAELKPHSGCACTCNCWKHLRLRALQAAIDAARGSTS